MKTILVVGSALVLLVACSGNQAAAPHVAWKDMAKDQKFLHMKTVVYPAMKSEFQQFNAEKFDKFECSTCHGVTAKEREFKMPNPDLPPLPMSPEGWAKLKAEKPQWLEFMHGAATKMAGLLDEAPYDAKTGTGFGCADCHTMK